MQSLKIMPVVMAGAFLLLGGNARASELDVKVPFPFVVAGKTMPAGEYRVDTEGGVMVLRGEKGTRAVMITSTIPASGQDPAGVAPALTFTKHEDQFRLNSVWESRMDGQSLIAR